MQSLEDALSRLSEVSRLLDETTEDLAEMDNIAVKAKVAYMKSYATAFMRSEGSMDLRRYAADLASIEDLQHKELCESNVRVTKERLRTLRDQMEILRTTAAGLRVQFQAEPTGQWS